MTGVSGSKWKKLRTHCRRGHEFTEANTYLYRSYRYCRACDNIRKDAYSSRKSVERLPEKEIMRSPEWDSSPVSIESQRAIFSALIRQAIDDIRFPDKWYLHPSEVRLARRFLFEDGYTIQWGDKQLSLSDILDLLDMEITSLRKKLLRLGITPG